MREQYERAKEWTKAHFVKHKTLYLCGLTSVGTLAVAGITCSIMRKNVASHLDAGVNGPETATAHSFSFNFLARESGNIVTTIHTGGKGHPGFRVRSLEHGLDFDTQGAAARALGVPENIVSKHLNGKLESAYGNHLERIPA